MSCRTLCVLLGASSLLLVGCGGGDVESEPIVRPVRFQEIYSSASERFRSFPGVAKPGMESNMSFKVAGNLQQLPVRVGDHVVAGQLIAELDPSDYRLQVQEAEASLARSRAEARNAAANYERVRALYENKNASLNDLDGARSASESAAAQEQSAKKRLELARLQLSYTRLVAPISGGISAVDVEVNENVNKGTRVVLLTGGSELEVEVSVSESLISSIREGNRATVTFDALAGQQFEATVTEVGVSATGGATTFPVRVNLAEPPASARPGMAATVNFRFEAAEGRDSFIIPTNAVGEDGNGRFVYLVDTTGDGFGTARRQEVVLGELTDGGFEVFSGLTNGDLLVTAGVTRIRDGQRVKLRAEGE